jgi:hypothetical protein
MYWFVGRTGPVRTSDFYRLLAPFTFASLTGILACMAFRHFFYVSNPALGLAVCATVIVSAMLLVLSAMPSGRLALHDIKNSLLLLRPVGPKAALEAQ